MKKVLSFLALAALLLALMSGCSLLGLGGENQAVLGIEETRAPFEDEEVGQTVYPVGNTASFRNWEITLNKVYTTEEIKGSPQSYYLEEDEAIFVVADVTIKNVGDSDSSLLQMVSIVNNEASFFARESDYYYTFDDDMMYDESDIYGESVAPGESLTGTITFIAAREDIETGTRWYVDFYTEGSTMPGSEVEAEWLVFTVLSE